MKAWFKSKGMWLGFAVAFLGLLQTTLETAPIPEEYAGLVTMGIGLAIGAVRTITTTAIGSSDG